MLERLKKLVNGEDTNVPEEWRQTAMQHIKLLLDFTFLHDIGKINNLEIRVDGKILSEDEYKKVPKEIKRDPERTIIKFKDHENSACKILKGKISNELDMMIGVHGINDIFRKNQGDEKKLCDAYASVYRASKGDETLLKLAFLAMYLDAAASFKVRVNGEKPHTEEKTFCDGVAKAEKLFRNAFPLIDIKDRFPTKPSSLEIYRQRFLARRVYDTYASMAEALGFPRLKEDFIARTKTYIDDLLP